MTQENVTKFCEAVVKDSNLQQQIFTAPDFASLINTAVKIGAEKGYSFTEQELKDCLTRQAEQSASGKLSDADLEMVAGGDAGEFMASASLEILTPGGKWIRRGEKIVDAITGEERSCMDIIINGNWPGNGNFDHVM